MSSFFEDGNEVLEDGVDVPVGWGVVSKDLHNSIYDSISKVKASGGTVADQQEIRLAGLADMSRLHSNLGLAWVTGSLSGVQGGSGYAVGDKITVCAGPQDQSQVGESWDTYPPVQFLVNAVDGEGGITDAIISDVGYLPVVLGKFYPWRVQTTGSGTSAVPSITLEQYTPKESN